MSDFILLIKIEQENETIGICNSDEEVEYEGVTYKPSEIEITLPKKIPVFGKPEHIEIKSDKETIKKINQGNVTISVLQSNEVVVGPVMFRNSLILHPDKLYGDLITFEDELEGKSDE